MLIYLSSVEEGYRRIILRKLEERFAHDYFQTRIAQICARSFASHLIDVAGLHKSLRKAPQFTHLHGDRELVFISNSEEADEDEEFEQLYSL